jgi:hypothetical protein
MGQSPGGYGPFHRLWFMFSRLALCVIVAFGLGGCVANGDEHGGMISGVSTLTVPGAMIAANSWCGRYGLAAEETRMTHFENGDIEFACVPPLGKLSSGCGVPN